MAFTEVHQAEKQQATFIPKTEMRHWKAPPVECIISHVVVKGPGALPEKGERSRAVRARGLGDYRFQEPGLT